MLSGRKRITKASYCKDGIYQRAKGEGGQFAGQELRYSNPEFHILHNLAGLRTCPVWFLVAISHQQETSVPGSQFSVRNESVLHWELRTGNGELLN